MLARLEAAVTKYPRLPRETHSAWLDRVTPKHLAAREYHLALAFGIAKGAGVDLTSDEFDVVPQDERESEEEIFVLEQDGSVIVSFGAEKDGASSWRRKPLGDFSVDDDSWVTVRIRFNRDHYMSDSTLGCIGSSRVGTEVEAALASGHTYDSIFQEGLTKISQIDGNYLMVPVGDLMAWGEEDVNFLAVYRALVDAGTGIAEIFKAGLTAVQAECDNR